MKNATDPDHSSNLNLWENHYDGIGRSPNLNCCCIDSVMKFGCSMGISQIFVALLALSITYGFPIEDYYVNGGAAYPNQQFFYNYQLQPRSTYFYPTDINKPEYHPELGMSPQYHDIVYNYVKDFAGTNPPPHADTFRPFVYNAEHLGSQGNVNNGASVSLDTTVGEKVIEKPGLNDYFLPSDFLSQPSDPKNQFYGRLDAVKMRRISPKAQPTSLPPIGGVISNYVLMREQKTPQNLVQLFSTVKDNESALQHIKRQTPDNSDGVEILAEPPQSNKMSEEMKEEPDCDKEEEQGMDAHPGIAQSKPSAIALAGPGGMAQASPVGTALVGQGGLAVAAPSGTAVAGPGGQGAIPIQIGGEKQKKDTTEKSEEADTY